MVYNENGLKNLCSAVIMRAVKDYKSDPSQRESIEKWISEGNIYTDYVLPDTDPAYLIRRLKQYD